MDTTARFALVGPGRAGTAITEALVQAGWRLSAVAGRSADAPSARALADRHHAAARPVAAVAAGADVVVVATPDAALAAAAAALAPSLAPGTLVVHLAGSLGLEVFDDLLAARRDTAVGAGSHGSDGTGGGVVTVGERAGGRSVGRASGDGAEPPAGLHES
ncbi:MAG TPA: NAD(P)-binding domain-containing protein, partial [Acidimicrobiia bacterium]|nr:NAD(P)-binding domain-containing protein [Acidimicrobiia bacterium]